MSGGEDKKSTESSTIVLPDCTQLYKHQVAGHQYDGKSKLGILKHACGTIVKAVEENDHRAERELSFYENVFHNPATDPMLLVLRKFLPAFGGTCVLKIKGKETKFMSLEDVCETYLKPSIVDIKIGIKTYDPEANETKIKYEKSKYMYSEILGFRILGMKIYNYDTELYLFKDKKFGKQIVPDGMKNVLELMLTGEVFINCLILSEYLHKLTSLLNWFEKQRKFAFYSSSILFVYEGILSTWYKWIRNNLKKFCIVQNFSDKVNLMITIDMQENDTKCSTCHLNRNLCLTVQTNCKLTKVKIIDCAHVFPTKEEDTNFSYGLEKLISYIKSILSEQISLCK